VVQTLLLLPPLPQLLRVPVDWLLVQLWCVLPHVGVGLVLGHWVGWSSWLVVGQCAAASLRVVVGVVGAAPPLVSPSIQLLSKGTREGGPVAAAGCQAFCAVSHDRRALGLVPLTLQTRARLHYVED